MKHITVSAIRGSLFDFKFLFPLDNKHEISPDHPRYSAAPDWEYDWHSFDMGYTIALKFRRKRHIK